MILTKTPKKVIRYLIEIQEQLTYWFPLYDRCFGMDTTCRK